MKIPTKPIKVPLDFKNLMESLERDKIANRTIKRQSMPKLVSKLSKHRFFPQIINDLRMEKCEW